MVRVSGLIVSESARTYELVVGFQTMGRVSGLGVSESVKIDELGV
jgi:hypothetical protein